MSRAEVARNKRRLRRTMATIATLMVVLTLAALWIPVANTYRGAVDGDAVSTHHFGVLSWATVSWWGPAGELLWPLERLRPKIHWNRLVWTVLATALLFSPLLWLRVQLVDRQGRRWVELRPRSTP